MPSGRNSAEPCSTGPMGRGGSNPARLALSLLEDQAAELLLMGIAPSTQQVYSSAQQAYRQFCSRLKLSPLPASQDQLVLFVTELAQTRAPSTIRTYLAGIRHYHIISGYPNPLQETPKLSLVLKGIQRTKPLKSRPRLPITPYILHSISTSLDTSAFDDCMLWAACLMGFYGFLRCAEFTTPCLSQFTSDKHLSATDVAVDNRENPTMLAVKIKSSKTDPFGEGVTIYLGKTDNVLCPVAAILEYLIRRGNHPGPLFVLQDGRPLSRSMLVEKVRQALRRAGIDASEYNGHSFRIGAATTAAAQGISVPLIKTLGRWRSEAFHTYIKIPRDTLASVSATLSQQ